MRTFGIRPGSMGVLHRIPTLLVLGLLLPVSQSVYHTIEPVDSAPSVISSSTHAPDSTPVVVYSTSNLVVIESKQRQKISYRHGFQILTERLHSTAQVSQRRSHLQKRQAGGASWGTDVTPYSDRQAAATGTPLKNMGGLELWSFFGELIRQSLQTAFGDFSFLNNLNVTKFATGQGLPIFAFVSVLILIILGTLMAIPFSCCCLFGGCCLRGKVAYQPWKRTSTAVCIVIFSVLLIIGGITNISGSAQLTLGIRTTWGSANGLVDDARTLINSLDPTVQQILKFAETTVNGTIDNFATVDVPLLKTRVGGQVTTMVESLQAIQTDLGFVKQVGTTLQSALDDLTTQVGTLETQLNAVLTSVQGLNDHLTETTNNIGYELIQDITGIPSAQTIDVSGLPNITQLLEPLDTVPDLDETATTLTNQFDGLDAYVNDLTTSQTSTIKDQIKVQIDSAGVTVSDMITQQVSSVSSQIDGFEQDAGVYVGYVSTYDGYRHLGMICLSGLVFAIMLAVGGGIVTKSKRVVCCCGVTVVPLVSLIALIGLVYFAADLAVGTVCTQYNDRLAHVSVSALSPDMVTMIQETFDVIDKCYSGNITLLDVGQEYGMDINVTAMLVGQLASFDVASFAGQVNLSSAVPLDQYDVGSLTSSFMGISVNLTVFDEISTSDLRTSMGDLSATLQDLDTNLDPNMFQYDSPPTQGDMNAVVSDFRGRIAAALVLIAQVNTTEATVSGTLATIRSEAAEMVGYIDSAQGEGANASTAFDVFSTGVDTFLDETQTNFTTVKADQVLADINGLAVKVDETLTSLAQCVVLSSDVKATLNYLCISTLGGLDALWFSLVFMSIFLICMSITTCCAACRLADPAAYDGDASDEYGDKSKQRYKPTKPTIAKSFSLDGIKKSSPMTPGETITTSREEVDRMLRQQDEEKAERKKKLEEENDSDGIVTLRRDGSKASSIRQVPTVGDPQRDPPFRNSMTGRRRASITQASVLNRGPSLVQTPTAGSPSSSKIERSDYLALSVQTGTPPIYSPSGTLTNQKPKALTPKSMTLTGAAPSSNQQNISTLDDIEAEMARLAQDTGSESEKEKKDTLQPNRTRASTFGNGDRNADGIPTTIFEANSVPIISVNDPAQLDQINAQLEGRGNESVKGKQNLLEETSGDSRLSISIPPYSPSDTSPLSASEHAESPLLSQPPLPSFPPPSAPEKFQ